MGTRDKRVDAYIANAPEFAQPILERAREWIHEGCPEVEETLKWRTPTFMYNGILCGTAAFKSYAAVHFWKGTLVMSGGAPIADAWGDGGRLTKVSDLPPKKEFLAVVKQAAALNANGVKLPRAAPKTKKPIDMPPAFLAALKKNKKAHATFEAFPPSHKREYLEWITDAKTEPTRDRRIAQAVEWIADGKQRNWKYMRS